MNVHKRILIEAVVGVIALLGIVWFFHRGSDITNYPSHDGPVVMFGDSLVQGVGATPGNSLSVLLSRMVSKEIVNLGVSGDTTADGLARLDKALAQKPSVLVILLGGNDYLRKVPIDDTFLNLRKIIARAQAAGAVTMVLGVRGGLLTDPFESRFEDLAESTGSVYVPDVLDGLIGNTTLMADAVHPNDQGYLKIAEKVYPKLKMIVR